MKIARSELTEAEAAIAERLRELKVQRVRAIVVARIYAKRDGNCQTKRYIRPAGAMLRKLWLKGHLIIANYNADGAPVYQMTERDDEYGQG